MSNFKVPEYLFNSTAKDRFIKDLNLKVPSGRTVDIFKNKNLSVGQVLRSYDCGDLHNFILQGIIEVANNLPQNNGPPRTLYTKSDKPLPSKVMVVIPEKGIERENFISAINKDFLQSAYGKNENDIAKQSEEMINSIDLDGFADPLKED